MEQKIITDQQQEITAMKLALGDPASPALLVLLRARHV